MFYKRMHWIVVCLLAFLPPAVRAQISPNQYYGSGIQMDSLANLRVSAPVSGFSMFSYRFRATQNSTLTSVRPYLINYLAAGTGYCKGDGGDLRLELRADDGLYSHLPSSTVLATVTYSNAMFADSSDAFHQFTFPSPPTLTAGKIYHLVWTNMDGDPANNYVSLNFVYHNLGQDPAQPTMRPDDFAALGFDGAWKQLVPTEYTSDAGSYTPIANLAYGNGTAQGLSYYQNSNRHVIGGSLGTSAVQQVIDVTGANRRVVRISTRAKLISGTAPLRIQVRDAFGGTINDCLVPTSKFSPSTDTYVTCAFTTAATLTSGQRYFVTLQASAGTTYDTMAPTNHAEVNPFFGDETSFPDGYAEYKVDGGAWTFWDNSSGPNTFFDLQFYFTLE